MIAEGQLHGGLARALLGQQVYETGSGQLIGVTHLDLPATPDRAWQASRGAQR